MWQTDIESDNVILWMMVLCSYGGLILYYPRYLEYTIYRGITPVYNIVSWSCEDSSSLMDSWVYFSYVLEILFLFDFAVVTLLFFLMPTHKPIFSLVMSILLYDVTESMNSIVSRYYDTEMLLSCIKGAILQKAFMLIVMNFIL